MIQLNNPKTINAWCMYDWANSVYSLVITSAIFPIYYENVTKIGDSEMVSFFGFEIVNTVLYSYSISFSFLLAMILSPLLTGIADYTGKKKRFMQFFCYLGSFSCMGLYFFDSSTIELGVILFVFASLGWSGSIVFYNSFLPEIATEDRFDAISAKGYALGYIGSVLLLVFNLAMVMMPDTFGISDAGMASRISFFTVGVWWLGFSQYTFYHLPKNVYNKKPRTDFIVKGIREIKKVYSELKKQPVLKTFLIAFFFYNMGVQTVMYLATIFGSKELKLPTANLIGTILILQLVAIGGAYMFSFLSKKYGNKHALLIAITIWVFICVAAYYVSNGNEFYILAFFVGLVMGGIQSLSRSTYAKLIPDDSTQHASYFSFYDVLEKLSIVMGTASYALIEQLTGSMRNSTLFLMLFFIIGFVLMLQIPSFKTYSFSIKNKNE
jgi:MFS transporter, UMF1 family